MRRWDEDLDTENVTALLATIMEAARPLVGLRSKSNIKWYHNYPLLVAYTEVDLSSKCTYTLHMCTHTRHGSYKCCPFFTDLDLLREQLLPIADDLSGQLTIAISDESEFEDELKSLGLDDWGEDVAIAIWASSREKYPLMEEYDSDSLREFIQVSHHL